MTSASPMEREPTCYTGTCADDASAAALPAPDDCDALLERLVDLTIERDAYRLLAQRLMHALHHVTRERDQLREQRRLDRMNQRRRRRVAA